MGDEAYSNVKPISNVHELLSHSAQQPGAEPHVAEVLTEVERDAVDDHHFHLEKHRTTGPCMSSHSTSRLLRAQ